jgi:hypothetical protein
VRVFVSTPVAGNEVSAGWLATLEGLSNLARNSFDLIKAPRFGISDLVLARNAAVHEALKAGADVLLTFDSDQYTDPENLMALIESEFPISALAIRKKKEEVDFNFVCLPGKPRVAGDWVKVAAVGSGAMAVKTQVLFALAREHGFFMHGHEPIPYVYANDFADMPDNRPTRLSEDYTLCTRANNLGYGTWIYHPAVVTHFGVHKFEGRLTV